MHMCTGNEEVLSRRREGGVGRGGVITLDDKIKAFCWWQIIWLCQESVLDPLDLQVIQDGFSSVITRSLATFLSCIIISSHGGPDTGLVTTHTAISSGPQTYLSWPLTKLWWHLNAYMCRRGEGGGVEGASSFLKLCPSARYREPSWPHLLMLSQIKGLFGRLLFQQSRCGGETFCTGIKMSANKKAGEVSRMYAFTAGVSSFLCFLQSEPFKVKKLRFFNSSLK